MSLPPSVKNLVLVLAGPAGIAFCEVLRGASVLNAATLGHAALAAVGAAFAMFLKVESGQVAPPASK